MKLVASPSLMLMASAHFSKAFRTPTASPIVPGRHRTTRSLSSSLIASATGKGHFKTPPRLSNHQISLRNARPDWNENWRNAKTGGPACHRRHIVRSGLIRSAIKTVFNHAVEHNRADDFYRIAQNLLGLETKPVESNKEAEVLINTLYSRLHNQHMNIFYGRGSYNQMLGTLSHGLEKYEADYLEALDELIILAQSTVNALQISDVKACASQWFCSVMIYAITEYMEFQLDQIDSIDKTIRQFVDTQTLTFDSEQCFEALQKLHLFDPYQTHPINIHVDTERQKALCEASEFIMPRIKASIEAYEQLNHPRISNAKHLIQQLKDIATETLDSANLDLSESHEDELRKIQNQEGIRSSQRYAKLVEEPSLRKFKRACQKFLETEQLGAQTLALPPNPSAWFNENTNREMFIEAITSDVSEPMSIESARFNPRQWTEETKSELQPGKNNQRLQVISSILARQIGYAISNLAFATDQIEPLQRAYERILKLEPYGIENVDQLQRAHSKLINIIHNKKENLYVGTRGEQAARETLEFALLSNEAKLTNLQLSELSKADVIQQIKHWRRAVMLSAIKGYLHLTTEEENTLSKALLDLNETKDNSTIAKKLLARLKPALELFAPPPYTLDRYTSSDAISLRRKTESLTKMYQHIKRATDDLIQSSACKEQLLNAIMRYNDALRLNNLRHLPTGSTQAHKKLASFIPQLLELQHTPTPEQYNSIIPRYEALITEILGVQNGKPEDD